MSELTPREIVAELDKYIIGQNQAKRMVAIAVRNRWRRQRLAAELRNEVAPRNIIMMGPTGVGKTEIARRLAKLCSAPFIKVEATKYTEVGYVGRDVESMIRDLMEIGINLVRAEEAEKVKGRAEAAAEERLLDLLLPSGDGRENTREKLRELFRQGFLDDREVEFEVKEQSQPIGMLGVPGMPFRHGGRAFRIHGPSRMGQQNAERYRKALLAQRHPPVGRRHGHPRHARHGRRQNGLRRTPVRAALRLHRRWSRRLDITAYGPLSGHKYATRPERRRAGRAVLEVGAVRKPRSLCRKRAPSGRRAGQSHPLYPKKIRTIQIHYRK